MAEGPLHVHDGVVVVGAVHGFAVLGDFVVVGVQGVDVLGIGERQPAGEVLVAAQQGSQGVGTEVGGQHYIHHCGGQRLNVANQARTALVQNQDDGLAGTGQGSHQLLLGLGKVQVVHVAGGLAIGIFAYANHHHVCTAGGGHGLANAGSILGLPVGTLQILHAGLIAHVLETVLQGLHDGIVLRHKRVGIALPTIAPAAVERTQGIGVGPGNQDAGAFLEGKNAVILEQDLALQGGGVRFPGKLLGAELRVGIVPNGLVEQAQAHLQTQDAAHGVVQAGLGDSAFLDAFHNGRHALRVVRVHNHVDTGVDAHGHGLFLIGRYVVAHIEVVNVGPVRHEHAVPTQLFLDPAAQKDGVGVRGDAIDGGAVHHGGEGAGAEAFQERGEELLAEVVLGDNGRRTVLAAHRNAITDEVLEGNGAVLQVNMIGIFPLNGDGFFAGHFRLQIRVFAIAFPQTRPARVAAQVHHRGEHPRHLRGAGLIGHGAAHHAGVVAVEGGGEVNLLRIKRAIRKVRGAVNHVQAINTGNAYSLHALFLNLAHHSGRLLARMGGIVHHIEDGPHLVLADNLLQLGRVDGLARAVLQHGDVQLDQLTGLLFQGHALQDFFHLGFHRLVGGYGLRSFGRASDTKERCRQHNQCFFHIVLVL